MKTLVCGTRCEGRGLEFTAYRKPIMDYSEVSSVNKNIPIFYDLLIKSLLLLTDYKNMNKEIKKLLRCIKHLSLRPDLSFCEFN